MLIAQITDPHITRDGEQARYLADVMDWIEAQPVRPDAVVLSGDLTNGGVRDQYLVLRDILARCPVPAYVVPGNHDRRATLREVLPGMHFPATAGDRLNYAVDAGPLRLIGLDTAQAGRPGGFLGDDSLAWLDGCLAAEPARPAFIFMHHPPFRTGVRAADVLGFQGVARFRSIVARHPAVRRIVAGHIHCERRAAIAQALATTGVSSTPQRVPEIFERQLLALRPEAPGFTLHAWSGGGGVSTTLLNMGNGRFAPRAAG